MRMNVPINAKRLRATLPDVVERVRKGTRFTVIYRSRPAFQIVTCRRRGQRTRVRSRTTRSIVPSRWDRRSDGRTSVDHDASLVSTMNAVFVDTGGWMACADRGRSRTSSACTAARDATLEAGRTLVTTDFVGRRDADTDSISPRTRSGECLVAADRRQRPAAMGACRERSLRTGAEPLLPVSRQGPVIHGLHEHRGHARVEADDRDHHRSPFSPGRIRGASGGAAAKSAQAASLTCIESH